MKITLEQNGKTISIEVSDSLTAYEMINDFGIQSLLAIGFHPDSIKDAIASIAYDYQQGEEDGK